MATPIHVTERPPGALDDVPTPNNSVSGMTCRQCSVGAFRQDVFTLTNVNVTMTDGGANGSIGNIKLYNDTPAAFLEIQRFRWNFTSIARVSTGIIATATVKAAVGVAAETASDSFGTTGAATIVASASASAMVAGVTTGFRGVNGTTPNITDATAGAEDVFINFGIADAGSTATDALTVSGTITVTYYLSGV